MSIASQLERWDRGARATKIRSGLLFLGDPNLVDEEFKDDETRALAAAGFAGTAFGYLRAKLGMSLTPAA